jgi:hypothetical protein
MKSKKIKLTFRNSITQEAYIHQGGFISWEAIWQ